MAPLRFGSLNINGERSSRKRVIASEIIQQRKLDVIFCWKHTVIVRMKSNGAYGGRERVILVMGLALLQE